ncbi:MAG: DUF2169 domain-containing protein [Polyangiaceae bacterium]
MFVENRTALSPKVSTRSLPDADVTALAFRVAFTLEAQREFEPLATERGLLGEAAVWGSSWALSGHVQARAPRTRSQRVTLRFGAHAPVVLDISGDRTWQRRGDDLVVSETWPFETVALSAERAFGGSVVMPAGERDGALHPSYTIVEQRNPFGIGLVVDVTRGDGVRLPNVEFADARVESHRDRPDPAVLRPLPSHPIMGKDLDALAARAAEGRRAEWPTHPAHHRATYSSRLAPGEMVVITGARDDLVWELPPSPALVSLRRGRSWTRVPGHIRHVAIDLYRARAEIVYGHAAAHDKSREVTDARVELA